MSRQNKSKYIEAAYAVLAELGGGPIPSHTLINMIVEKGLLPSRQYLYHNVLKKVRDSELFDTSVRGQVSLAQPPMSQESPELNQIEAEVDFEAATGKLAEKMAEMTEEFSQGPGA